MHRIDGPGATVDNKFTEGDPVGGVPATVVTAAFMNDVQENLMAVLAAAGVTPTKGRAADLLDSIKGRLIGVRVITVSGIYTKTPGTNTVIVEVIGSGGGSGSCQGTSASAVSISGAGGGGGYAVSRLTSGFDGVLVTIGAGGTAGTAGANNAGTGANTSFGGVLQASGGVGGQGNSVSIATNASQMVVSGTGGAATGGNLINSPGLRGIPGVAINSDLIGGVGGTSGRGTASGADGKQNGTNQSNQAGSAGQPGKVIVWEYA